MHFLLAQCHNSHISLALVVCLHDEDCGREMLHWITRSGQLMCWTDQKQRLLYILLTYRLKAMKVNLICLVYIMLAIQYLYLYYPWYIILPLPYLPINWIDHKYVIYLHPGYVMSWNINSKKPRLIAFIQLYRMFHTVQQYIVPTRPHVVLCLGIHETNATCMALLAALYT